MNRSKRADLQQRQAVAQRAARADAADVDERRIQTVAIAMMVWFETVIGSTESESRATASSWPTPGTNRFEIERDDHRACGHGAGKPRDE